MTKKTNGNFFAVDRTKWLHVVQLGLNPAVAFLVLARYSDKANRYTKASIKAVTMHTGISRGRAVKAVAQLEAKAIKNVAKRGELPRYDLMPSLWKAGKSDWIWLPNSLIDGVGKVASPVEQIRRGQDCKVLQLFVDLYGEHDLSEDGGISRSILIHKYTRERLSECGAHTIWGWAPELNYVTWGAAAIDKHKCNPTPEEKAKGANAARDFFARLGSIVRLGLAEWMPYVAESGDPASELLFPIRRGHLDSQEIEERIWRAAHEASHTMLAANPDAEIRADDHGLDYRAPLPSQYQQATIVGVLRLLHRPRTKKTSVWWARYRRSAEMWLERFEALAEGGPAVTPANDLEQNVTPCDDDAKLAFGA
jgi:hypothetical protein